MTNFLIAGSPYLPSPGEKIKRVKLCVNSVTAAVASALIRRSPICHQDWTVCLRSKKISQGPIDAFPGPCNASIPLHWCQVERRDLACPFWFAPSSFSSKRDGVLRTCTQILIWYAYTWTYAPVLKGKFAMNKKCRKPLSWMLVIS